MQWPACYRPATLKWIRRPALRLPPGLEDREHLPIRLGIDTIRRSICSDDQKR
jgi:hypothetical protein